MSADNRGEFAEFVLLTRMWTGSLICSAHVWLDLARLGHVLFHLPLRCHLCKEWYATTRHLPFHDAHPLLSSRTQPWYEMPFASRRNIALTMIAGSSSLWLINNSESTCAARGATAH